MTPAEIKRMDKCECIVFLEDERPIRDRKALPWENNPLYDHAMELNKKSGVGGYIVEPKSMIDPHTGEYVTIKNSINIEETSELPEGVKPIDVFSDEFLHMNFTSKEPTDEQITDELKRLYKLKKNSEMKDKKRKAAAFRKNVTESVTQKDKNIHLDKMDGNDTSVQIPDSIEDGIIHYFGRLNENQRHLIQTAIEKGMQELLIRRMFVLSEDKMEQLFNSYFN